MSTNAVTSGTSASSGTKSTSTTTDAYANLDLDTFVQLLVAELQNQDPMNPMDNSEILSQVSQIRSIESNQRLTDTLESVMLGQSVATGANLINRTVTGLDSNSEKVTGQVDSVSIVDGATVLHVGEHEINLNNVSEINSGTTESTTTSE